MTNEEWRNQNDEGGSDPGFRLAGTKLDLLPCNKGFTPSLLNGAAPAPSLRPSDPPHGRAGRGEVLHSRVVRLTFSSMDTARGLPRRGSSAPRLR
jgi:hypothetical protein